MYIYIYIFDFFVFFLCEDPKMSNNRVYEVFILISREIFNYSLISREIFIYSFTNR
jgi:hypothetical protein